ANEGGRREAPAFFVPGLFSPLSQGIFRIHAPSAAMSPASGFKRSPFLRNVAHATGKPLFPL
ncbi:MAG: hypothetical protein IKD70_00905, partial [Eggerthellaceae bacterium]|nr:hypothetical protein [Eggerthellaceae bacterium]